MITMQSVIDDLKSQLKNTLYIELEPGEAELIIDYYEKTQSVVPFLKGIIDELKELDKVPEPRKSSLEKRLEEMKNKVDFKKGNSVGVYKPNSESDGTA